MPKTVDEDRARRKEALEQKRLARKAVKDAEDAEKKRQEEKLALELESKKRKNLTNDSTTGSNQSQKDTFCYFTALPDDAMHVIYSLLSSADLGRLVLTCKHMNITLTSARLYVLSCRLSKIAPLLHNEVSDSNALQKQEQQQQQSAFDGWCGSQQEVRDLLEDSITSGGDTGRILPRGKFGKKTNNEFISYLRFVEDAICGYNHLSSIVAIEGDDDDSDSDDNNKNINGTTKSKSKKLINLPKHVQGRFVSCSPEHTVCRVGGDGTKCGAGGSGVATWGIGRRGQLGHGKREDERYPKRIVSGTTSTTTTTYSTNPGIISSTRNTIDSPLGYSTRIVQVSAGGGLVRVAQTLLLTDTGRVMSFGTGQYGALGHGLNAAKQLPDILKPVYVNGPLEHIKCICVSAGELHCGVVTVDGDVYTWGDGFCGQLGHGDKRPQLSPKLISTGTIQDEIVSNISCGCRHTLAVTEDGEVYSWGLGHYGVLGRSYTPFEYDSQAAPMQVVTNDNEDDDDDETNEHNHIGVRRVQQSENDITADINAQIEQIANDVNAQIDLIANLSLDDSSDQCIPTVIDSLKGICIVGACAGHRHSIVLDNCGALYTFGAGYGGCLGHGDTATQMYPCRIQSFDDDNIKIHQMSAGVDISMAVTTCGDVYSWGKMDGGRIGLGLSKNNVTIPRRVVLATNTNMPNNNKGQVRTSCLSQKAVDVECGYVHSVIVGINGTIQLCGGVGVDGEADGQSQHQEEIQTHLQSYTDDDIDRDGNNITSTSTNTSMSTTAAGRPVQIPDFNIWHRLAEPTEFIKREKWKKLGKYEVKGRSQNL